MSREGDFKTRMAADVTLMAILTGGVYTAGELGRNGSINRQDTPNAFDATTGRLKPCAFIRQRAIVPDGGLLDMMVQDATAQQTVMIFVYQDAAYDQIDLALARQRVLFFGYQFSNSFEVEWAGETSRLLETGSLDGAPMARQEWLVASVE